MTKVAEALPVEKRARAELAQLLRQAAGRRPRKTSQAAQDVATSPLLSCLAKPREIEICGDAEEEPQPAVKPPRGLSATGELVSHRLQLDFPRVNVLRRPAWPRPRIRTIVSVPQMFLENGVQVRLQKVGKPELIQCSDTVARCGWGLSGDGCGHGCVRARVAKRPAGDRHVPGMSVARAAQFFVA